jgi:hypothetical protein
MQETRDIPRLAAIVPGFVIGVLWLAMAATALWSSARGYANDRSGWGLGWGLVGVLLLGAALAALVGTWWHNFRVRRPRHH